MLIHQLRRFGSGLLHAVIKIPPDILACVFQRAKPASNLTAALPAF
jgi:hypothetical protein